MSMTVTFEERATGLDDRGIAALASQHGTPLYVYDLDRLRTRTTELWRALAAAHATLFFATMANDRVPVLRFLAKLGLGACVNSIPHLDLAIECGFSIERVQFTSTGLTRDDMCALQERGIKCNVDSLAQLESWFDLGGVEAGVRINAASIGRGLPKDRIGIEADQVSEAAALAATCGGILNGLHIYVGTNFQYPGEMLPTLDGFFDLAASVETLSYVNIGGGIGINYKHEGPEFDVSEFGREIAKYALKLRHRLDRNIDVIVEPGRGLAASCGTFVTAVTDVKWLEGRRFAAVDGSVAVFPRPFHHPDSPHHIRQLRMVVGTEHGGMPLETIIVGRTTFSRDILGLMRLPEDLRIGDLLALADAGAYSQSMASRFLGQREPKMVFLGEYHRL